MKLDEWYESRAILRKGIDARMRSLNFLWSSVQDFLKNQQPDAVTREKPFDAKRIGDNGDTLTIVLFYQEHFTTVGSRDELSLLPVLPHFVYDSQRIHAVSLRAGGYIHFESQAGKPVQLSPATFVLNIFEELVDRPINDVGDEDVLN